MIEFWKRLARIGRRKRHVEEKKPDRIYQRKLRKDAVDIIELLERVTTEPLYPENEELPKWKHPRWSDFKNVWHLASSGYHMVSDTQDLIRSDLKPSDLRENFDISFSTGLNFDQSDNAIGFRRFKYATMEEVRGRVIRPFPLMAIEYNAFWDNQAKVWAGTKHIFGYVRGQWAQIEKPTVRMGGSGNNFKQHTLFSATEDPTMPIRLAMGLQLMRENNWFAYFGMDSSFRLGVPVDAASIPTLFKQREKDGGKKRRDTLRTWVREHQRILKQPDYTLTRNTTTTVREHLRGAEDFNWHGLNAQIRPALLEEEANVEIAQEKMARTLVSMGRP